MEELHLERRKAQTLAIDGHVFELQLNEVEVLELVVDAKARLDALADGKHTPKQVLTALKYLYGIFDKVLGDGAMEVLSEGKPVSLNDCIRWLYAITPAAITVYADDLAERYA